MSKRYNIPWKKLLIDILDQTKINGVRNKVAENIKNTLE
jgi:hypothetical protein